MGDRRDLDHDGKVDLGERVYGYVRHPHVHARSEAGPVKVSDRRTVGVNGRIALRLTALVGTMQCAYLFTVLALLALPGVMGWNWLPSRTLLLVGWISQTLIQLVMLAVLQLGQNLQGAAADKRAKATYADAEAILHEAVELQAHLAVQDAALQAQDAVLASLISHITGAATAPTPERTTS
jgi:hypothetical protein